MTALEYRLSFSDLSGETSLHPISIQKEEIKFPLMMFGWAVMSVLIVMGSYVSIIVMV